MQHSSKSASAYGVHPHGKGGSGLRGKIKIFIILSAIGVIAIFLAILSLFLFEIEDTIYANGIIIPEKTFDIVGHIDAHVTKFNFRMGEDVKTGDVIAELDSTSYESRAIAAESAVRELSAELDVKRSELEILEKEPLPKELWYTETNLRESTERNKRMLDRLERSKKLQLVSAISKIEFEKIELDAIESKASLERANRLALMVRGGLGKLYVQKAKNDLALVKARLDGKSSELEFLRQQIAKCRLVAPENGRIIGFDCKDSWYVARGKIAATIAAGTKVRARAKVDARVVRKVKPKQVVRVTSDVYNKLQYGNFKGFVRWIGDVPVADESSNTVYYPVEIELDPEGYVLKYGSGVELAIVTGKQPAMFALLNLSDEDMEIKKRRAALRDQSVAAPVPSGKAARRPPAPDEQQ